MDVDNKGTAHRYPGVAMKDLASRGAGFALAGFVCALIGGAILAVTDGLIGLIFGGVLASVGGLAMCSGAVAIVLAPAFAELAERIDGR